MSTMIGKSDLLGNAYQYTYVLFVPAFHYFDRYTQFEFKFPFSMICLQTNYKGVGDPTKKSKIKNCPC